MDGDDRHTVHTAALSDLTDAQTFRQHALAADTTTPVPSEVGERYAVERMLGEGGMGKVMLCADAVVGRRVAMKVIKAVDHAGDARTRFLREARIQGQLEHPSIVPVYDLGSDASGDVFFTMKRVRGITLADIVLHLRANDPEALEKYSPRRLLAAFDSVCLCIDFAHQHGVVHRDLKPANIMLGDFGEVYVLDWGIARVAADAALRDESSIILPDSGRERSRSVVGTFGYMAPEQMREAASDARSDVYALGAILFELLTLERLHPGTSIDEIVTTTMNGADARPSRRAPSRLIADELEQVCVRATASSADARFQSARALHEAIEHYLDRELAVVMRREAANEHIAAASTHLTDLAGASTTRKALQEFNKALALDPHNEDALRRIAGLLEKPLHTPREVKDEMERIDLARRHYMAKIAAASYASFLLFIPLMLAMGVRNWPACIACLASSAAAALWALLVDRYGTVTWPTIYVELALSNATFSICSVLFGPLLLIPAPVIANTLAFALVFPDRRRRAIAILAGLGALILPLIVEALGLSEPSYTFVNGGIFIRSATLDLPPTLTMTLLLLMSSVPIVVGAIAVGRLRDALYDAEHRLHTQAWMLRQLLPSEAIARARP